MVKIILEIFIFLSLLNMLIYFYVKRKKDDADLQKKIEKLEQESE